MQSSSKLLVRFIFKNNIIHNISYIKIPNLNSSVFFIFLISIRPDPQSGTNINPDFVGRYMVGHCG